MRIAILQPTFLPWAGWFDIADQVDRLVLLDDVPFSKQSWQQRNRLRTPTGLEFVTVPVRSAGRLGQPIHEVEIADPRFAVRLENTVRANYARCVHFDRLFPTFREALHAGAAEGRLAGLNTALIQWLAGGLAVSTAMCSSSTIAAGGRRGEYVAALCAALGATQYLSPAGAEEYLSEDREAFDRRGIRVQLHQYVHPEYPQAFAPFLPYASALDLLFNAGDAAGAIMRSGRRPARALGTAAGTPTGGEHGD